MSNGNAEIIELLNEVLTAELTAINQYFLHAEMCENWGYERLKSANRRHSIDEMKHAEKLIERILFLKGIPNVQRLNKISIGESVPEQLALDMTLEREAVERLNAGLETCRSAGDGGSRRLLEECLESEEEHIEWLDAQLEQIEQMGISAYLAEQIHE